MSTPPQTPSQPDDATRRALQEVAGAAQVQALREQRNGAFDTLASAIGEIAAKDQALRNAEHRANVLRDRVAALEKEIAELRATAAVPVSET